MCNFRFKKLCSTGHCTILLDDSRTYPDSVGRAMIDFNEQFGYNLISTTDDCRGIARLEKITEETNENS